MNGTLDDPYSVICLIVGDVGYFDETVFNCELEVEIVTHSDEEVSLETDFLHEIQILVDGMSGDLSVSFLFVILCVLLSGDL